MPTAAQLYTTLHHLASIAEAPDATTRTQGINRNKLLALLGITISPNTTLTEAQERAFERAKQTLRDTGAHITHHTTHNGEHYRLNPTTTHSTWNPTHQEFRLLNTALRGWENTELQDDAYRILRKITLTSDHLTDEALAATHTTITTNKSKTTPLTTKTLHYYRDPIHHLNFSDNPHLHELFTAYTQRKTITFTYQTGTGTIRTYKKVSIAGIGYRYGAWYFAAHYPLRPGHTHRKIYTYRFDRIQNLQLLSRTDPDPIDPNFNAHTWLTHINGYEEPLTVTELNPTTGTLSEPFTVPSYGAIDSAIEATIAGWLIQKPQETHQPTNSTRQHDSHTAQQELLHSLITLHTGAPTQPKHWTKTTQRNRNDTLDTLTDLLLALHRADRWAATHHEEPMPLRTLTPLYSVDNGTPANLTKIITQIFATTDTTPFHSDTKNPDTPTPTHINLLPDFNGTTPQTLLNYTHLTDTELAILIFTLSAITSLNPNDPRPNTIITALTTTYPQTHHYTHHLLFAPEEHLLKNALTAITNKQALTINYGNSTHPTPRTIDPYTITLDHNRLYLHAWCRTSEERYRTTQNPTQTEKPTFWRNFLLTRITHYTPAGPTQPHPITGNTVNNWRTQQHRNTTNPHADLHIHPTNHIPNGEPLDTLTTTYQRRSTHHIKEGTKTTHTRIHYYTSPQHDGNKNIINTVIAHRGSLEITAPTHLRTALLNHLTALANATPTEN